MELTREEIQTVRDKAEANAQAHEIYRQTGKASGIKQHAAAIWSDAQLLYEYTEYLMTFSYTGLLELQALAAYGKQFLNAEAQPKTLQALYRDISPKKAGILLQNDLAHYIAVRANLAAELGEALRHVDPDTVTLKDE
ncbi:MAG TPA: hypothetical protein PK537_05825 [Candidatus Limiplasma sp.]|nr:hypothetical protein [Candidatus Limiplasma sp.]